MKFPYTSIFYLSLLFLGLMFLRCNTTAKTTAEIPLGKQETFTLKVERGAFHYDSFILEGDTLRYIPQEKSNHSDIKYNRTTKKFLDSSATQRLFEKIVQDGFWELNPSYQSNSSCTSQLLVTLETNERTKTVTCDDFERDCPELIKYIDQKVVELEGNRLVRIYLPG